MKLSMSPEAAAQAEELMLQFEAAHRHKSRLISMASDFFQPHMDPEDLLAKVESYPRFPIGISEIDSRWDGAQGLTLLSGRSGLGKSMITNCAAMLNAQLGLPVIHFDCENPRELTQRRTARFLGENWLPELSRLMASGMYTYVKPKRGHDFRQLVRFVVDRLKDTDALIITDSVHKLARKLTGPKENFLDKVNKILEWMDEACQLTDGHLRFLCLAELNADGEVKGREGEYTCSMSIRMNPDEEDGVVRFSIGKHRDGPGYLDLGRYRRMVNSNSFEKIIGREEFSEPDPYV